MSGQGKQNREAPASPSPAPPAATSAQVQAPSELTTLRADMVGLGDRMAFEIATLRGLVLEMRDELATLRADARHGVTMQAPRALTKVEVATVLAEKPAPQFIVLAPFPALNLNAGDRFDARTRFARLDDLPLHVERGLKITIPPQA